MDEYEQAFKDLELAISLDYMKTLFLLYPIKWNEKEFNDFVNKFPNDYRIFMFRGIFIGGAFGIKSADMIEQTIADYQKALDLNPNSAICKYLLGIAYDALESRNINKKGSTAVLLFTQAIQLKPMQGEIFYTLKEAQVLIEEWRLEYNTFRPHSSLKYRPPAPEAWLH